MKKSKGLSFLVCMFSVALLLWPGFAKTVGGQEIEGKPGAEKKAGETSATKGKFSEEKKEFEAKAKARYADLDKKIKKLEAESKKTGAKVKTEAKEGLQELKEKRAALKKEIKKLKARSKAKWEEAKQKIQAAEDELEEAYNRVRDKFKSE